MKLAFQLAYKNLMGAGLRTWLNAIVLSFSFVIILFFNGLMDGWNQQAKIDSINWEYGKGQLLHQDYDPNDPFTIQDGHGSIEDLPMKKLTPILFRQASIFPQGRMLSVTLKGIDAEQRILQLPTEALAQRNTAIPAIIGKRMATSANLKVGDEVLMRWRDNNGTFDAQNIEIVKIFDSNVSSIDQGQVWISLEKMYTITGISNEATLLISNSKRVQAFEGWKFKSQKELLQSITDLINTKKTSSSILYIFFLAIALLAIFDTQVLSIYRRQREIGTYIALGMTRWQVVGLFTVEGSMYSIFAMILGSIYGIPFLYWVAEVGFGMPAATQDMGVAIAGRIYPIYGLGLILGTMAIIVVSATIVSFLPARKIAKMKPVEAIKGKLQ